MLEEMAHNGARVSGRGGDRSNDKLTFAQLGINGKQAVRWQEQASLPHDEFEAWLKKERKRKAKLVTAAARRRSARLIPTVCSILPPSKSGKIKVHPVRRFVQKVEHQKDHRRANQHLYQTHGARSARPGINESRAIATAAMKRLIGGLSPAPCYRLPPTAPRRRP